MRRFVAPAIAAMIATASAVAIGGAAGAATSLSLSQSTGLADGQLVTITVSGLTPDPFGSVTISQCGNAYADNTALPSVDTAVGSRDCQVLAFSDPSALVAATSLVFSGIPVAETGIGNGNRSCVSAAPTPCIVYVSESTNEGGTHPSVSVSFASDASGAAPAPTVTTASLVGEPIAVSKPAYAHVSVHRVNDGIVPEGSVSVSLDGGTPVA